MQGFNDPLVFISIKNKEKIRNAIDTFQKKNILNTFATFSYQDVTINQVQLSSFFKFLSDIITPDIRMPFYAIYDEYIVISKEKGIIQFFIDSIKQNKNLLFQEKIRILYSYIKKGNIISYWNLSRDSIGILKSKNLFTRIIKKYNYGMISMEFVDQGIKSRIIITEPRVAGVKVVDGWPVNFDSPIWASPIAYNIDNKNLDEIILATEDGTVFLYDFFGERLVNWPVKMNPKIMTSPLVFFHPLKNTVFICAGATSGEINFWNIEGFLMENSPVSIEGRIEKGLIVRDINNDTIPEIIAVNNKGKIYVMNIDGTSLPGFPVQLDNGANASITLMDIGNDKNLEIIYSPKTPDGDILFINNSGTIWDEKRVSTGSLNFSDPVIATFDLNIPNILLITEDGNLFCWDQKGGLIENFPIPLNDKFLNSPCAGDINNDGTKEIAVISANGILSIINNTGEIVSQVDLGFRPVENEKIIILDVDKDGKKEIIIPGTDNFIRFYDSECTLLFKIKGVTTPFIKDMDKDRKYEIITASDEGDVYLYKLP